VKAATAPVPRAAPAMANARHGRTGSAASPVRPAKAATATAPRRAPQVATAPAPLVLPAIRSVIRPWPPGRPVRALVRAHRAPALGRAAPLSLRLLRFPRPPARRLRAPANVAP